MLVVFLLSSCKNGEDVQSTSSNQDTVDIKEEQLDYKDQSSEVTQAKTSEEEKSRNTEVEWMHFEDLVNFDNAEGKKYIVDVYTTWCGWCKVMDKQTFADADFQTFIADKYHLVKFDAEQKEPISFKKKKYEWQEGGRKGVNALALELLENRLSYPSLVFLDENMNKIKVSPGFKKPEQLISELEKLQ